MKKKWKLNKFTMDEDVYVEDKDKAPSGGSTKLQAPSKESSKRQATSFKRQASSARGACDNMSH